MTMLTIVTVTKNCADTLKKTIESVSRVKKENIEYLIIDGKSTDNTLKIIQNFPSVIDFWISESDCGIYDAMNKGVKYAKGKYVIFLNGDDEFLLDDFNEILRILFSATEEIVAAVTKVKSLDRSDNILIPEPWMLYFVNAIPHPSTFVRRDLLLKYPFRTDLKIASDYDFFLKCLMSGIKFKTISNVVSLHNRGGASGDKKLSQIEVALIKKKHLGFLFVAFNFLWHLVKIYKKLLRLIRYE